MTNRAEGPRCYRCGRASDRTLNERGKFTVELRPYGPGGQELHEFAHRESPRCPMCGRVEAAADCEDDPTMCWWALNGVDPRCDLLRAHYAEVQSSKVADA